MTVNLIGESQTYSSPPHRFSASSSCCTITVSGAGDLQIQKSLRQRHNAQPLIPRKPSMLRKPEHGKRHTAAGDPGGGAGRLLEEIEALSRALSLSKKPPAGVPSRALHSDPRLRSISAGKTHFPDSRPKARTPPRKDPQPPPKEKRSSSSTSSSIWSWKPLKALSHIRHRRFDCRFTLQVHSVHGLPSSFSSAQLVVHWKRNLAEIGLRTRPTAVVGGTAEFEETLEHRCAVYGSRGGGPHHAAKYESRPFVLYPAVVGAPGIDLGKHRVDLTRLLPLTLEELEDSTGKWSTSFKLSGKGRGASLNVSFGFAVIGRVDSVESGCHRTVSELLSAEAEERVDEANKHIPLRRQGSVPLPNSMPTSHPRLPARSMENIKVYREILPSSKSEPESLVDGEHLPNHSTCDANEELNAPMDQLTLVLKSEALCGQMEGESEKDIDCPEFTVIDQGIEITTKDMTMEEAMDDDGMKEAVGEGVMPHSDEGLVENNVPPRDADHAQRRPEGPTDKLAESRQVFSSCDLNFEDEVSASASPPLTGDLSSPLRSPSVLESLSLKIEKDDSEPEHVNYMEVKSDHKTEKMSRSLSLDNVTELVASEFLSVLGIEHSPFGLSSDSDPESPRGCLWKQFKKESLANRESIFENDMEKETELDWGEYPEDFDLSSIVHAAETEHQKVTQALKSKSRAKILEDAETEALMREWGLNENAFQKSQTSSSRSGFGSPIDLPPEDPLDLPPLGEGLGPFFKTKDGGFLRSMNPSLFRNSKHNGSLVMQVSCPVVVPAEMGSSVMEILQRLASVGIEKLSMQASKLMPLEDITGKTMQQVAWEALPDIERHDLFQHMNPEVESGLSCGIAVKKEGKNASSEVSSSRRDMGSDYVSLEDLAPLAMEKVEALSIEGLRIQSGMSDEDAPSNISPQSIGEISALEGKGTKNDMSLGLEGAASLQLLDVKDSGNDIDGLMGLSLTLDEWMKLDSGIIDEDQISDRTSKILAAHHAASAELVSENLKGDRRGGKNSCKRWGLLGNTFTVALMVQLRDPLRNYEPVGTPMLSLIQVERVFVPQKPKIYGNVSAKGNSEQYEELDVKPEVSDPPKEEGKKEELVPQFKITEVHVAGLKTDPGKKKPWGNAMQQQSGSRWLLANGMGKSNKHPLMKSRADPKPSQATTSSKATTTRAPQVTTTTVKPGDTLWSISTRVHGTGAKWKDVAALNPHIRNPNILLPNQTIRLR